MFQGKESFQALVLMILNSLIGSKFSFVQACRNNRFILWCSHTCVQEKKQTDTHAFDNDYFTQEGVKPEHIKRKAPCYNPHSMQQWRYNNLKQSNIPQAQWCHSTPITSHQTVVFIQSAKLTKMTVANVVLHSSYGLIDFTIWITKRPV